MNAAFHLITGDLRKQETALRIVRHTVEDETLDLDSVVVVAQYDGIEPVTAGGAGSETVRDLLDSGVSFRVCTNTLTSRDLDVDDLVDGVEPVSSGSGELIRLQDRGFAYLRP